MKHSQQLQTLLKNKEGITDLESEKIGEIASHLMRGAEEYLAAAKIWGSFSNERREFIYEKMSIGMRRWFIKLEKINEGTVHPMLVEATSLGERYLEKLPYSEQEKFIEDKIPVLSDGKRSIRKDAKDLTREEVVQVFDRRALRVRTPSEQKAWKEDRDEKIALAEFGNKNKSDILKGCWKVVGSRLYPTKEKAKDWLDDGISKEELSLMMDYIL